MRHGRRDSNHKEIKAALKRVGCSVVDLGDVGDDVPDLLVGYHNMTILLEVKSEKGQLTDGQARFQQTWRGGRCFTVRSVAEALVAVGIASVSSERGPTPPPN